MGVALVTGGAKGLGAAISLALAAKGMDLLIHYNQSQKAAQKVAEKCSQYGIKAEILQGDFSTVEGVLLFTQKYKQKIKETYALINNVGNYLLKNTLETSRSEWFDLFQTNLHTPFLLIQELVPLLIASQGIIINIGMAGIQNIKTVYPSGVYSLTKSGLWVLTRLLAKELAEKKVRVNMVSPGFLENSIETIDPHSLPMKRSGTLEETARIVAFLVDKESEYITGQNIEVAGAYGL